jgi:hypothetical protein
MRTTDTSTSAKPAKLQSATTISIGLAIVWNFITNAFPPSGITISELSNTVFADVKIIPANYAFSIWGLIYIGLVAFGIYQLDPRRADNFPLQQTRPWIILASVLQCLWVLLFTYQQIFLSSIVMLGILWSLIKCYRSLHTAELFARKFYPNWVPQVFSIYLGWISVATIVNIASMLVLWGWEGSPLSPDFWTLLMLAVSVGLAVLLHRVYRDRSFGGVIIWATLGVIFANLNSPAIILGGLIAIAVLVILLFQRSTAF